MRAAVVLAPRLVLRSRRRPGLLFAFACLGAACSADPPGGPDGGDGGSAGWPTPPAPPAPPASPGFTPCPPGWREVPPAEPDGVVTCDPWPEGGPHECAEDEAHFPGEPGCTRIGAPCPAGDFPEGLPSDLRVLYVNAGAPAGGRGTREAPFAAVADAVREARPGTVVALGKGTYDEAVSLPAGVTLWGACVALTLVTSSLPSETAGTITVAGRDTAVRNLSIGGRRPGVWAVGERSMTMDGVLIRRAGFVGGIFGRGAVATMRDVAVRETQSRESGRQFGRGLAIERGAQVEVSRAVFERNREAGVHASGNGTTLRLSDLAVRETQSRESDRQFGRGLALDGGAQVEVDRAVFERNREVGVHASGSGTTLRLSDVAVRETQSQESDRQFGAGLFVGDAAQVEVSRAVFERNRTVGAMARHAGTILRLADLAVRETLSQEHDRGPGLGLAAESGAMVEASRAVFERNRDWGVFALGSSTTLRLADVAVRETQSRESDWQFGGGLFVGEAAQVEVSRAVLERNRAVGAMARHAGTTLRLVDLAVRETLSQEHDHGSGLGLAAESGAMVEVSRAVFERNRAVGVFALGASTTLRLADAAVRETQSRESDRNFGRGLEVTSGARAEVVRAVFERNRDVGVFAADSGAALRLADVAVRETQSRESDSQAGIGVGAYGGGRVDMSRFLVARSALVGLQLAHGGDENVPFPLGGTIALRDGEVSGNPIGVNVQTEGFDLSLLVNGVVYRDNGRNLDASALPVPEPDDPLPEVP